MVDVAAGRVRESNAAQVLIHIELAGTSAKNVHVVAVEMNRMGNGGSIGGLLNHPVRPLSHVSASFTSVELNTYRSSGRDGDKAVAGRDVGGVALCNVLQGRLAGVNAMRGISSVDACWKMN